MSEYCAASGDKHIMICTGPYCSANKRAKTNIEKLRRLLDETGADTVSIETTGCMSMCGAGPNVVICPDEIIYHHVDEDVVKDIVRTHL